VDYLEHCLAQWKRTGLVPNVSLRSLFPSGVRWIEEEKEKLSVLGAERAATTTDVEALETAVRYEQETDAFYRKLVSELPKQDQALFDKFLGIEDGHLALLQAQLDAVQNKGFWFDISGFIQDG
jgi:rubrerythrin